MELIIFSPLSIIVFRSILLGGSKKVKINVINETMELTDVADKWVFNEKYQVWMLEDVLYTSKATAPAFQRLSIFVPKAYMKEAGVIDETATCNGYNAASVPVFFENNSAGYMQMPHTWIDGPRNYALQYLEAGMVYVTCGNRGHETMNKDKTFCGKSPANLIDLKTAIRFIRHNKGAIPGDMDKIISVGWSAGGAMSTLLAVTGDNAKYTKLLEENGAFMDESDSVFASQIYCPIIDLEHADLAYEWMFRADKENEPSFAGPAATMTDFEDALSEKLYDEYIKYFNSLELKNPENGELLVINEDGRSGSGYDYLLKKLSDSATKFIQKLSNKELPDRNYSVEDYLNGNYEYEKPAPAGPLPADEKDDKPDKAALQSFAGQEVGLGDVDEDEDIPFGLGALMLRPADGKEPDEPFKPQMMTVHGKQKTDWLECVNGNARVTDLDKYVLNHRRRMKPCPSFDILSGESGENKVFGNKNVNAIHFNEYIPKAIEELKDKYPEEYGKYFEKYSKDICDEGLVTRKYLINPLNFIGTDEVSKQAKYYRIRVGASDADTSLSVSMTLACKLKEAGYPTDYELVWEQPHSEADYQGEVIAWIEQITK